MDSPLVRIILATLGGYLLILLFISVYDWILEEYPRRPTELLKHELIEYHHHHSEASKAIRLFSLLPEHEKAAIRENLESSLISMEQWLTHLIQSDHQIICIGELHEESTRNFLAEEFFAKFSTGVLLLEATPNNLKRITKRMEAGRDYFPLLDADIMNILRTVRDKNPTIKIWGIEETDEQQKDRLGHSKSRDQYIAHNFWDRFQPGQRHIILFGALHCTNEPNWLFKNLSNDASLSLKEQMLNVQVLGEHQNGPLEGFVYFLDEIGIEKKTFVIPDTRTLHPYIYEVFQLLKQQTLDKYYSLIVFRTRK